MTTREEVSQKRFFKRPFSMPTASWIALGLFLLIPISRFITFFSVPVPRCHFKTWTGWPCPTCGTTRLFSALSQGDLVNAFVLNPLVFCSLLFIGGWGVLALLGALFGNSSRMSPEKTELTASFWWVLGVLTLLNWVYLITTSIA